ncbi:MAG: phenylalanine--tRNA ligase subunit beta [Candidatus Aenigmatarchaeota archaeon]
MVVIEISKKDLLNLLGKEMTDDEIEEVLFLIKIESRIDGDVIECEMNPDRPDFFSVEGIVRWMKGFLEIESGLKKYDVSDSKVVLKKENSEVRPYIGCGIIKDVELTDNLVKSLMQVQEKLHDSIGRGRKKVAIGVHDFDKMKPPLVYRDVEEETFVPLGKTKEMTIKEILTKHPKGVAFAHLVKDKYPLIYDKEGVISFPPIINSERTRVTENTKTLFLDVTGTDEKTVNVALNILACNILERCGKLETVKVGNKKMPDLTPVQKTIDIEYINKIIGLELTGDEIVKLFEKMRYSASKPRGGKITVSIPPYRADILHAIDLVEDVAIGYGYNNLEPEIPELATIGKEAGIEVLTRKIRELMVGLECQEIVNFVLTSKENNFSKMNVDGTAAELMNPISSEYTICRTWLLPCLIRNLVSNKHRDYPQRIFEIGDCVALDETEETGTKTIRKLAGVVSYDNTNLTEMKSIIESVLKNLGYDYQINDYKHPSFIETRVGEITVNEKQIGFFGEIKPEILEKWKLEKPVIAFEIEVV